MSNGISFLINNFSAGNTLKTINYLTIAILLSGLMFLTSV